MKKAIITPHLGIELTQRCNLNCRHCFRGEARNKDISREIIEKVFDEVKYVGTLDLSGGEVFLAYEHLKMLLEIAKEKEVKIESCSMLINGTIYDERIYKLLDEFFGEDYQVGISSDDFHDKSIQRIYGNNQQKDSKNPNLHPLSMNDVKNNMSRHMYNEHSIGFQRVSNRLIENGRAINTKTPHKEFEALGYYYNNVNPNILLVGPMVFVGADGYISDINSDVEKRKAQSLGNLSDSSISALVLNGGIEIKCGNIEEFFELMEKREYEFATHQGDHLGFQDGEMIHIEYKEDEEYKKAVEELPEFLKRASQAILDGKMEEFIMNDEYFKTYQNDISQIDHDEYPDDR